MAVKTERDFVNVVELTPLYKGSYMPTKICRTFTGMRQQFWPGAIPAVTNDSWVSAGVEPTFTGRMSVALTTAHGFDRNEEQKLLSILDIT